MALIDNIAGVWHLDEASGNAVAAVGGEDLTETSGTIDSVTGNPGTARDLEAGDTEYFAHADSALLSMGDIDFSWSIWFKAETLSGFPVLIKKGNAGATVREYIIYFQGNVPYFGLGDGVGYTEIAWSSGLSTASWYHLVVTYNASTNTMLITVNNGTPVTGSQTGGAQDAGGEFQLGAGVDQGLYFDGVIQELNLWKNKALSAAEITQLYNSGTVLAYPYSAGGASAVFKQSKVLDGMTFSGGSILC